MTPATDESGDEYFVAQIEELDGVTVDGRSAIEALHNLRQAFDDYLNAMLEWGEEIPEPRGWPDTEITKEAIRAARASASRAPVKGEVIPKNRPMPETKLATAPEYELA